jgi:Zn finger protein HypA/HybF involved in hydrogenase expression
MSGLVECFECGTEYPPHATRWRCPACGMKDTCCEGEPAVACEVDNGC